ncbi:unnamed protein product [Brassica rapa subsp. narinosa]
MFRSSTYATMITKRDDDFFIKTHGHIALLTYPFFKIYSLKRLYHMRPDCFNPYSDRCNLTEQISLDFSFNSPRIFNPSGSFIYLYY